MKIDRAETEYMVLGLHKERYVELYIQVLGMKRLEMLWNMNRSK